MPGVELNFGAVGKGWALDRIAAVPARARSRAGRSCTAGGSSHRGWGGEAWELALRAGPARSSGLLRLRDAALGTSASGEQHFEADGRRFGHVLDPRTGWPAEGVRSASVVTVGGRGGRRAVHRLPRRGPRPRGPLLRGPPRARWRSSSSTRRRGRSGCSGSATASRWIPRPASAWSRRRREGLEPAAGPPGRPREGGRARARGADAGLREVGHALPRGHGGAAAPGLPGGLRRPRPADRRRPGAGPCSGSGAAPATARSATARSSSPGRDASTRFQDLAALPDVRGDDRDRRLVGLRRRDRRPPPRRAPAPLPARDAEGDARLEPVGRPLEAPQRHPLPARRSRRTPTSSFSTP